ncbi:MAG TPA: nucleoside triphosphate pyrophosphohydrolase [Chromatiaceae bacterium]|nr:nucleoside triphosphate pyrophosphohydrolase [Chromatiaceae bacterium]
MTYKLDELLAIMARLRDPHKGCPWDQKQTWASIAPYTVEEAYEVADAIENGDFSELKNELGDLLFQVVFYAQMGKEQGLFDFDAIVDGICKKMIRRHPHVFGDVKHHDDAALKEAWEQEKHRERLQKSPQQRVLDGVARALPALVRADKLQKRAARVGFDWPDAGGAMNKVAEELAEVQEAVSSHDKDAIEDEVGDLLFAAVNVARLLGVDAEQALRRGNRKFERRFQLLEQDLRNAGQKDLHQMDLDQLEQAWQRVKSREKKNDG